MDTMLQHSATLPTGEIVAVSHTPEEWWTTQNGSGYVHPNMLAPDPAQPRKHINPDRLAELQESIASVGVRETITVTPFTHAPWVKAEPGYEGAFFLIVSGHRRWNGARAVELKGVPVRVKIYDSKKEHTLDTSLLNKGREDLTPLEEGWEIVRLKKEYKIDDLAKMFGVALPQLYNRMNLTKLHPDIQALLDPELPPKQRLPTTIGGILGGVSAPSVEELDSFIEKFPAVKSDVVTEYLDENERRFLLQKLLLQIIQLRQLNSARAIEFVRDRTLSFKSSAGRGGKKPERYEPKRRKEVLDNFVKEIIGTVIMDWPPAELRRIFELSSREDVEERLTKLKGATDFLLGLQSILEKLRDEKKPMHPDVLRLMQRKSA